MFSCKRCGHVSKYKGNLLKHLRNKAICEAKVNDIAREQLIEEIEETKQRNNSELNEKTHGCDYCDRKFNHVSNKYKHEKVCPDRNKKVVMTKEELRKMEKDIMLKLRNQLKAELRPMSASAVPQVSSIDENKQTVIIDNSVHITNINVDLQVTLKYWGASTTDHVTTDKLCDIMDSDVDTVLVEYINTVHFDKDTPEMNNIRFIENDNPLIYDFDGDWISHDMMSAFKSLLVQLYYVSKYRFEHDSSIDMNKYEKKLEYLCNLKEYIYMDGETNPEYWNNVNKRLSEITTSFYSSKSING